MKRLVVALFLALAAPAFAAQLPPGYAIATAHPLATAAGEEILQAGGNAFDAAVAITAALAVTEPAGSGLGGGGFYLLHRADDGYKIFVDARERAPGAATADMYLDAQGEVVKDDLRAGPKAAGIPGIPAALDHLTKQYGRMSLARSLAPAISYAADGFEVDANLARAIQFRQADLARQPAAAAVFLPGGSALAEGQQLVQPDLARTLERIATHGKDAFYGGDYARDLVDGVQAAGGIWSRADLRAYSIRERPPVILEFQGFQIVTAPPPSSGGLVMGEVFNMLAGYDWAKLNPVNRKHLLVEAWRRAYRDRALYMGDSDYVEVPSGRLLRKTHAEQLRADLSLKRATPSASLGAGPAPAGEGRNTTHFSVLDAEGNRVAATLSINYPLGAAFMVPRTGVLLNNEMDDFVAKPGEANLYGLVGGQANAIAPGKRMLSSMSPSFVSNGDRLALVGTPGGSRIITMVMLGILDFMDGADARAMVSTPRFHHQYLPDQIFYEAGALSPYERQVLEKRGHSLKESARGYGNMQVVIWDWKYQILDAASDPRGVGQAVVGGLARESGGD